MKQSFEKAEPAMPPHDPKSGAGRTVTLEDVAKRADVSTASVSRFLSDPKSVREARRARIQEAIDALGYIPHGAARALASKRTRTVGAIVPTLENAIFAQGIQGLQEALQEQGYTLFIASSEYSLEGECAQAETLIERGVDALMLVGSDHAPELYELLTRMKLPYVNTWTFHHTSIHPCIGFNNVAAAQRQTDYLIGLGHTRFAVIAGITEDNDRAKDRLKGILAASKASGISIAPNLCVEAPYDIAAARKIAGEMIAYEDRPTAIVCGNDVLAYGALLECQARGLSVPQEISIVGFDDLPMSQHLEPPLTTMHVPSAEMGRRAAHYLIAKIAGQSVEARTEVIVSLIQRGSAAPPKDV